MNMAGFALRYYFSAGQFTHAETGQTWFGGSWTAQERGQWSAYRIHDSDMQFFHDGVRLVTRIGDASKMVEGVNYKCISNEPLPPVHPSPLNSTRVWSYTCYY